MQNSTTQTYRYKIVKSGDEIEIYHYEISQEKVIKLSNETDVLIPSDEIQVDDKKEKKSKEDEKSNPDYVRDAQNIRTMKKKFRRLVNANAFQYSEKDKFLTLTFEREPTREHLLYCFKQFNKRLKRRFDGYKYIAIIERGTKNTKRLHLHCLFFGLPFIKNKELKAIWQYGYVKINAVDSYFDLANYLVKYIEKTLYDGTYIPKGKRFYFTSRGLNKPEEEYLLSDSELQNYVELNCLDKNLVFKTSYESDRFGCQCHYLKFSKQRIVVPQFKNEEEKEVYYELMQLEEEQREFMDCDDN